jgi:ubiquinone/menaquinone biosynthesis C-methylase UbiE
MMKFFGFGLYRRVQRAWQIVTKSQGVHDTDEFDASPYWDTYQGGTTQLLSQDDKHHIVVSVMEDRVRDTIVLDLGCGVGRANLMFDFREYHGLDTSTRMLADAIKLNIRHNKDNAFFAMGDGQTLHQYPDNYFDMVFSSTVFLHLKVRTVKRYAPEIYRVLKPNGFFLVNVPKQRNLNMYRVFHDFAITQLPDWIGDEVFVCTKEAIRAHAYKLEWSLPPS